MSWRSLLLESIFFLWHYISKFLSWFPWFLTRNSFEAGVGTDLLFDYFSLSKRQWVYRIPIICRLCSHFHAIQPPLFVLSVWCTKNVFPESEKSFSDTFNTANDAQLTLPSFVTHPYWPFFRLYNEAEGSLTMGFWCNLDSYGQQVSIVASPSIGKLTLTWAWLMSTLLINLPPWSLSLSKSELTTLKPNIHKTATAVWKLT